MKKVFFTTWIIALAGCIFILLCVHVKPAGRLLLVERYQNGIYSGGLYYDTKVDYFKEHFDRFEPEENAPISEADIIAFGDSCFNSSLGDFYFDDILEQETGQKVHMADTRENPVLEYLAQNDVQKGKIKFLILESIEFVSLKQAARFQEHRSEPKTLSGKIANAVRWRSQAANEWLRDNIVTLRNDNWEYQHFIDNNRITYPLNKWIANFRFSFLNEIDPMVSAYSKEPSPRMLFHKHAVQFNRMEKSQKDVEKLVYYVVETAKIVKERYGIQLIYTLIPNRYTLYHDFVNDGYVYDDYIPRVNSELAKHGIPVIDMYKKYADYRKNDDSKMLYHLSDIHWNSFGKRMFVNEVIREMKNLS